MSYMKGKLKILGGEIKMKGKFRILGNIGLALFLAFALTLASVPLAKPALAATAVTEVWVEFDDTNSRNSVGLTANEYIIHFKSTTALSRGVDEVTVTFPDGTTAMGGNATTYAFSISAAPAAADLEFSTDYGTKAIGAATWVASTSAATYGGYRVKVRVPSNYAAGTDIWLKISSTNITSAATAADTYKVKVSTTKDTTAVLSSTFTLGHATTVLTSVAGSVAPATAGASAQYIINFTPATSLTASSGTVTVRFPIGTTLPSSIAASNVYLSADGSSYTASGVTPTVDTDRRLVKVTTPIALNSGSARYVKFVSAAGIASPTISDDSGDYYVGVRTSGDREWVVAGSVHAITAGAPTKLVVANGEIGKPSDVYSDDATMINMLSSYIYIYLADANGNAVTPASAVTVTPSSSSGTGTFYTNSNATPGSGTYSSITSITLDAQDPADAGQQIFYKDTAAGTYTLTFAATGYTSATWTITVAPAVSLYDTSGALVSTYGATSTSPVAEVAATSGTGSTQKYSVDYISDAISAAMAGDTVKLGDGIYELDTVILVSAKITLTSVNGASSTTLKPLTDALDAVKVTTDGTSTNPIIIDGLTFTRLRLGVEFDQGIYNNGYDYLTVRNNVFDYIIPGNEADHEYGSVVGIVLHPQENASANTITSATISNNTFTNCAPFAAPAGEAAVINIMTKASAASGESITGVTISGNTLTNSNGIGININGYAGVGGIGANESYVTADITDNTLTNPVIGIDVQRQTHSVNILRNTVTGAYTAGLYVETYASGDHDSLVIKNNTFTGSAGADKTYFSGNSGAIVIEADGGAGANVVQYNAIYDNDATYSIYVSSDIGAQDAKYNWYGDATGPAYTALTGATVTKSNPNGAGKKVTDYVTYYPWLYKSLTDVVADNASYQSSTMKLVVGWNTLSTPVKLIAAADSIDELIPSGMTIGYYYDGGWQQITSGYVLNASDAVYVKMSAVTYVLLKFDAGAFTTPSKALAAGWNLVGLASLASSGMKDAPAVASVYNTAAGLPGYGQVISPSLNATQTDMYYNTGTSWSYSRDETTGAGTNYMYAGLGYWIYMQNAATMAGFEITPIAPDLD